MCSEWLAHVRPARESPRQPSSPDPANALPSKDFRRRSLPLVRAAAGTECESPSCGSSTLGTRPTENPAAMQLTLPPRLVRYRRAVVLTVHAALLVLAYLAAYAIRFDFAVPRGELAVFWATLPYVLAVRLVSLELYRLHGGYWRHFSLHDLAHLGLAVSLGSLLLVAARMFPGPLQALPGSVLLLDWLIAIFLLGALRFAVRSLRESQLPMRPARGKRTLIIGAGEAAEQFLRQALHDERSPMHVVALADDDPAEVGRTP